MFPTDSINKWPAGTISGIGGGLHPPRCVSSAPVTDLTPQCPPTASSPSNSSSRQRAPVMPGQKRVFTTRLEEPNCLQCPCVMGDHRDPSLGTPGLHHLEGGSHTFSHIVNVAVRCPHMFDRRLSFTSSSHRTHWDRYDWQVPWPP